MKNQLITKIMGNKLISKSVKFYFLHRSWFHMGGVIGFSCATTLVTFRNAPKINYILMETREALEMCNTKEERNEVYSITLREIIPLIAPIFIFQGLTIGCAVLSKKHSDELESKLIETAGALSVAQTAIAQYQSFANEAEKALGPEKVHEIQKEVAENTVYETSTNPVNSKTSDDDQLIFEPITGQLVWSTPDRVNLAWEKYRTEVQNSNENFVSLSNVFFERIGAEYKTAAAEAFGYYNEDASKMADELYFDTTKVRVNGKEMSALKIEYYPTVRLVTDERFD